jgi:hypothetical protein
MLNSTAVVFTKRFVAGNLTGLVSSPQFLDFPNLDSRRNWLEGVRANQERGVLNWVFEGEIFFYDDTFDREKAVEDYKIWAI